MNYFTPVRIGVDPFDVEERAPVCGMTREKAIEFARAAYGDDAAIENDETREVEAAS